MVHSTIVIHSHTRLTSPSVTPDPNRHYFLFLDRQLSDSSFLHIRLQFLVVVNKRRNFLDQFVDRDLLLDKFFGNSLASAFALEYFPYVKIRDVVFLLSAVLNYILETTARLVVAVVLLRTEQQVSKVWIASFKHLLQLKDRMYVVISIFMEFVSHYIALSSEPLQ